MSKKLYQSKELNTTEKLVLAYILKGSYRQKYIPRDRIAKELYISEGTVSKTFKSLEQLGLIKWPKVEGNKYKIIIVCQKAFNKYAFITDKNEIKENKLTRDPVINLMADMETKKDILIFKVDRIRKEVVPSWYNDYKNNTVKVDELSEDQRKEMEQLVNSMF